MNEQKRRNNPPGLMLSQKVLRMSYGLFLNEYSFVTAVKRMPETDQIIYFAVHVRFNFLIFSLLKVLYTADLIGFKFGVYCIPQSAPSPQTLKKIMNRFRNI